MTARPACSRFLVGAYPASPSWHQASLDRAAEADFYDGLAARADVGGLELPFVAQGLHRHDEAWFVRRLSPDWRFVVTCLPGTMERLTVQPDFGLASPSDEGRRAAVGFMRDALAAVRRLHDSLGRRAVAAIVVHSAPSRRSLADPQGSATALARSLADLAPIERDGVAVWLEHCDAFSAGHPPAKGFLPLADELAVLQRLAGGDQAAASWGVVVNWGRSALEARDADEPLRHVAAAKAAGLLRGLMFSGCTLDDPDYGTWADSHAPFFAPTSDVRLGCRHSLMTEERAAACLAAAAAAPEDALAFLGVKLQALPVSLDVASRLRLVASGLAALERATSGAPLAAPRC